MWPFIGDYVKGILLTTVQDAIHESLSKTSVKSFKFEEVDIGDVVRIHSIRNIYVIYMMHNG